MDFCSLGVEVGLPKLPLNQQRFIIAEVNEQMRVTFGDSFIHISRFELHGTGELSRCRTGPWETVEMMR